MFKIKFDTIDETIICSVLENEFNITGTVLKWFKSYLSNRKLRVNINGVHSYLFDLPCGVPQGSCL